MTIAVTVKVHDGIVIASDSATTMTRLKPNGESEVANVYNHANKIFNLLKGSPIGAVTAGVGSMSKASISTLAKDLRRRFAGLDSAHEDWKIDPKNYTLKDVAARVRTFFYEEHYVPTHGVEKTAPGFDFLVGGYSSNSALAELWKISVRNGQCPDPVLGRDENTAGIDWAGDPEAICRLVLGISPRIANVIMANGIPADKAQVVLNGLQQRLQVPLFSEPMPIMDAIDLAKFLVYTTEMFTRFNEGAPIVGGPIEIAAVTKHEGFKWVQRKHYFTHDLNPQED